MTEYVQLLNGLIQFGVAGLIVGALVLVARWYMPIADKSAQALVDNLGDINLNVRDIVAMQRRIYAAQLRDVDAKELREAYTPPEGDQPNPLPPDVRRRRRQGDA